jgi:hypothetical protein
MYGSGSQPLFRGTLVFRELAPSVPQKVHFTVLELKIATLTISQLVISVPQDFFTVLNVPQDFFPVSSVPWP